MFPMPKGLGKVKLTKKEQKEADRAIADLVKSEGLIVVNKKAKPVKKEVQERSDFTGDNALEAAIRKMSGEAERVKYKEVKAAFDTVEQLLTEKLKEATDRFNTAHTEDVNKVKEAALEIGRLDSDVVVLVDIRSKKAMEYEFALLQVQRTKNSLDKKETYEQKKLDDLNATIAKLKEEK